jgi:ribosomal protein L13
VQIIGRLAGQLSILLQGKDKPIFAPYRDHGDVCIVVNAEKAVFTGNKWEGKLYKWHTGKVAAAATQGHEHFDQQCKRVRPHMVLLSPKCTAGTPHAVA